MSNNQARIIVKVWKAFNKDAMIYYRIDEERGLVDLIVDSDGIRFFYSCGGVVHLIAFGQNGNIIIDKAAIGAINALRLTAETKKGANKDLFLTTIRNYIDPNNTVCTSALVASETKKKSNSKPVSKKKRTAKRKTDKNTVRGKKGDGSVRPEDFKRICRNCTQYNECFKKGDSKACERFHYNGGVVGEGFIVPNRTRGAY